MSNPLTPIQTSEETVSCNGGGGALGHPVTFYTFGESKRLACRYCGQIFIKK